MTWTFITYKVIMVSQLPLAAYPTPIVGRMKVFFFFWFCFVLFFVFLFLYIYIYILTMTTRMVHCSHLVTETSVLAGQNPYEGGYYPKV